MMKPTPKAGGPLANRLEGPKPGGRVAKAAIIMMALDPERSQRILSALDDREIRRLGSAMANLGRTGVDQVEKTVAEFQAEVGRTCNVIGTLESTEKLLSLALPPEKVAEIIEELKGPNGRNIWEKLANLQPQLLAGYLRNEYPQTVAVILAKLPAGHAARILRLLPERLAADVAIRMVRMNSIQRTVLADIEETLKREFVTELSRSYDRDSTAIMAEMLNRSEKDVLERIMATLEEAEPQAAARIRRIMFTFEDLKRVDRSTFGVLIGECAVEKLPVALSAASPELCEMFLSCMSERAANMLREEMETMVAPRRKAVDDAQSEIVALARRLNDEGRIIINEEEDENQALY
ncbi:flagellar motor switch protein FliG [Rhodopila globiformis]|nr:flagellar motor switch protein FliG [Rhodopila globiformis]